MSSSTTFNPVKYQSSWRGVIDNPVVNQLVRCLPIIGKIVTIVKLHLLKNELKQACLSDQKRMVATELKREAAYERRGQIIQLIAFSILAVLGLVTGNIPCCVIAGIGISAAAYSLYSNRHADKKLDKYFPKSDFNIIGEE